MSGNLFSNLLSLHIKPVPEEDFFTELIAWFLDKNHDVLFSWLKGFLKLDSQYSRWTVDTQVAFDRMDEHQTGSRPDILISLFDEEEKDYIIIESKISAHEGYDQLPRYAEQLARMFPDARKRILVYLTREYDPKGNEEVTRKVKDAVVFKQLRWHEFYGFLETQSLTPVLKEILEFMRTKHMAEITRLTPSTLAAFSSFPDVYAFFQTVLDGEVTDLFTKIFSRSRRSGVSQFQWRRHVLLHTTNNWNYLIGFWMPESNEGFPSLAAGFEIQPQNTLPKISELTRVFKQIEIDTANNQLCWKGYDLDKPNSWAEIWLESSFSEFIPAENHVLAMKQRLLAYLEETKRIQEHYPYIFSG